MSKAHCWCAVPREKQRLWRRPAACRAIPALMSHKPPSATLSGPACASAGCRVCEVHHLGKAGNGNTQWWLVCSLLPWPAGQDARLAAWPWCPGHMAAPSSVLNYRARVARTFMSDCKLSSQPQLPLTSSLTPYLTVEPDPFPPLAQDLCVPNRVPLQT